MKTDVLASEGKKVMSNVDLVVNTAFFGHRSLASQAKVVVQYLLVCVSFNLKAPTISQVVCHFTYFIAAKHDRAEALCECCISVNLVWKLQAAGIGISQQVYSVGWFRVKFGPTETCEPNK